MKTKAEYVAEWVANGDDGLFLEVLVEIRDILNSILEAKFAEQEGKVG